MSKYEGHTPGPWFIHDFRGMGGRLSISCTTPDHITVADIGLGLENTPEEAEANAHLIADAPTLLIQHERMKEGMRLFSILCRDIVQSSDNPNKVRNRANQIIRWIQINVTEQPVLQEKKERWFGEDKEQEDVDDCRTVG